MILFYICTIVVFNVLSIYYGSPEGSFTIQYSKFEIQYLKFEFRDSEFGILNIYILNFKSRISDIESRIAKNFWVGVRQQSLTPSTHLITEGQT